MPRYELGRAGKLVVQDWDVLTRYNEVNSLRYITPRQMAALISLAETLGWKTRYLNPPEQDVIDEFKSETIYNLMTEIAFCALVIGCITDDEDVRDALNQWFVDQITNTSSTVYQAIQQVYQQNVGGQPMPPDISGQELYDTDCVEDVVFGAIVYMIDQMELNNVDAQEVAEEITNVLERVNLLLGAIPVFETLPVDEVIEYAQTLWTDDLFEAYNAAVTSEYLNTLKCDLFCIALDNNCTLSIDLMFSYFMGRIAADPTNTLLQLIQYLVAGVWTGTEIPDTFFAIQLIAMKLGNQFFELVGLKQVVGYMAIGAHMPDSTWIELCDECPTNWSSILDFEISDYGFVLSTIGDYTEGVGFTDTEQDVGAARYRGLNAGLTLSTPADVTYAEMVFEYTAGHLDSSGDSTAALYNESAVFEIQVTIPAVPVSPLTGDDDITFNIINVQLLCGVQFGETDPGGSCTLKMLTLYGTGDKPIELP